MFQPSTFFLLVLGLLLATASVKCDPSLQIIKKTENIHTPVASVVEEKLGANFSLLCELVSSINDNAYYDDQISWGWETDEFKFANATDLQSWAAKKAKPLYNFVTHSEVNKAVKRFDPLHLEDAGTYFCMSLKYTLFKIVRLVVTVHNGNGNRASSDDSASNRLRTMMSPFEGRPYREFCNNDMFECMSNGICINQHYVCDGKADCKDGSDENREKCNGDPCKDKLHCDDGRCIPTAWCCDRHHDLNCTVTNRPTCCQLLSETYEELEYGGYMPYNIKHVKSNGARYLFISVCILSTFFSVVLLLLILSKVVIFAKKSAYMQARNSHFHVEGITLHHRSLLRNQTVIDFHHQRSYYHHHHRGGGGGGDTRAYQSNNNIRVHRGRNVALNGGNISDPLLVPLRSDRLLDQPPAYMEVVRGRAPTSALNMNEPPPPYTSREVLNEDGCSAARTDDINHSS